MEMLIDLIGSILILILSFGICLLLSESFRITLLTLSFEIGLFSAFNLIPEYILIIGVIIFAYSMYNLIWGTKDE